ncbi:uncharacterized protein LOC101745366 [Bombyx mori]|uniref:Lipocalin/cytosolic fatty-acid binding domain-containing protein n=1 Tax=Bombyx mori TaxID=7091 RepID=A0A8R1WHN6_BOMMO|nr:uncharacterized protein LOC101745366 [Bombyx mori]
MYRGILVFLTIYLTTSEAVTNSTNCGYFQADFDLISALGTWHVVAIIPEKLFPDKDVTCYKMEISETDEAGLRWLINRTTHGPQNKSIIADVKGTIVRQRYHTEHPFDVWSKSTAGIKGCFQQVLSLDLDKNRIHKTLAHDAMMQLHIVDSKDGSSPFLMQMLWGKLISVVVYRRNQGITEEQLKPIFELATKIRGPQRLPKICDNPLKDILLQ